MTPYANSAGWMDLAFFFSFCGRTWLSKWIFGRRSSYRAEDSHGPRLEHGSDQCPASHNYCLLWLIIPPSFDRLMVPNGSGGGGWVVGVGGGESGVLNLEQEEREGLWEEDVGRDEVWSSW